MQQQAGAALIAVPGVLEANATNQARYNTGKGAPMPVFGKTVQMLQQQLTVALHEQ